MMRSKKSSGSPDGSAKPSSSAQKGAPERAKQNETGTASRIAKGFEFGGRQGPDPTRYGDWENKGRCVDF